MLLGGLEDYFQRDWEPKHGFIDNGIGVSESGTVEIKIKRQGAMSHIEMRIA